MPLAVALFACRSAESDDTPIYGEFSPYPPGGAWVISGADVLAGAEGESIIPVESTDCGYSVFAPGDVDGDGVPEVGLVCDGVFEGRSRLWVYSGNAAAQGEFQVVVQIDAPALVVREPPGVLGDLDGDGRSELGLRPGGYGDYIPGSWGLVLPGSALVGEVHAESAAWVLTGPTLWTGVHPPQPAGDLDGDGRSDLVISGYPTFVAGGSEGPNAITVAVSGMDFAAIGAIDLFAAPLANIETARDGGPTFSHTLGDIDGDGRGDLALIGDPWDAIEESSSDHEAAVSLWTGVGDALDELPSLTSTGADNRGEVAAFALGDLDGDGQGEVAVWMYTSSSSEVFEALLAVVPGSAMPVVGPLAAAPFALAEPLGAFDFCACDLDGDGLPELLSEAGIWAGTDLLIPGSAPRWPGIDAPFACLGDLDGDGAEDVVRGDNGLGVPG